VLFAENVHCRTYKGTHCLLFSYTSCDCNLSRAQTRMQTPHHQPPYCISKHALGHTRNSTESPSSLYGVLIFGSTTAKRPTCYIELTFRTKLCDNLRAHALSRGIAHHSPPGKCWSGLGRSINRVAGGRGKRRCARSFQSSGVLKPSILIASRYILGE
jgi:hypothetical protein